MRRLANSGPSWTVRKRRLRRSLQRCPRLPRLLLQRWRPRLSCHRFRQCPRRCPWLPPCRCLRLWLPPRWWRWWHPLCLCPWWLCHCLRRFLWRWRSHPLWMTTSRRFAIFSWMKPARSFKTAWWPSPRSPWTPPVWASRRRCGAPFTRSRAARGWLASMSLARRPGQWSSCSIAGWLSRNLPAKA